MLDGLTEGTAVVTIGALALRDGDRVIVAGADGRGGKRRTAAGGDDGGASTGAGQHRCG